MRTAWYEKQGQAREVLTVGEMPDPLPGPGEIRIRMAASGINPGDIKKRQDSFGIGMSYPRVIPHSDGAGRWTRSAMVFLLNGWESPSGATGPSRIVRLVLQLNILWFR